MFRNVKIFFNTKNNSIFIISTQIKTMNILINIKKILIATLVVFTIHIGNAQQVGINTSTPHESAILDINSTSKGVLLPKVDLSTNTDTATITGTPAPGLVVYNLGTNGLNYTGYVYWTGTQWLTLADKQTSDGAITTLDCANATLDDASYTNGTTYSGTLTIPYSGGDGGVYPSQTIGPINGLTGTLTSGNFEVGDGNIVYSITGTPTLTSPATTSFTITIGGQTCTATVGNGNTNFINDYAHVNFEDWNFTSTGYITLDPALKKNIKRVKRLSNNVFRIDFAVPFEDIAYTVSGFCTKYLTTGGNRQPYLHIPNYIRTTSGLRLRNEVRDDADIDPGATFDNLDARATVTRNGVQYYRTKYTTHFYIAEGYSQQNLVGVSISATR